MSANNVFIARKHNCRWYAWDEPAEESVSDEESGYLRVLHYAKATETAGSLEELHVKMEKHNDAEYGWEMGDNLPKDGTPIKFI